MDDAKKMLRTIINGQSAMKQELLSEIGKVVKKTNNLENIMDKGFKNVDKQLKTVNSRIESIIASA